MGGRRRYRIRFAGPVSPRIVAFLQRLIPVLRDAPEDVELDIEIKHREAPDDRSGSDETA